MPATTGATFLLAVENQGSPGTYRTLGGQRNTNMHRQAGEANLTSKDSAGNHEGAPTIRTRKITGSIVLLEDDPAWLDLETCYDAGTQPNVRITTPAGHTYIGKVTINELGMDGPHDDAFTGTVDLTVSGALQKT